MYSDELALMANLYHVESYIHLINNTYILK